MKQLLKSMARYKRSIPVIEVLAQSPDAAWVLIRTRDYWKRKDKDLTVFRTVLKSIKKQRKWLLSLHDNMLVSNGKIITTLNSKEKQVFQEVSDNEAIS